MSPAALSNALLIAALGLAAALVLVLLARLLARAKSTATVEGEPEEAPEQPAPTPPQDPAAGRRLGSSFAHGMRQLRELGLGRRGQYRLPWCALLGAEGSRPANLLAEIGLQLPLGPPADGGRGGSDCAFWFFEHGLVLDLDGRYLLATDGERTREAGFRRFLQLLGRYRPERPLDAVLLTLPAAELAQAARAGLGATAELERRAGLLYRALWQLERQLGLRCPVYVLITGCEVLPGFAELSASLPAARRTEILGWSNPNTVDAAYRPSWVPELFATVADSLRQLHLEMWSERYDPAVAERVFALPAALAALAEPVRTTLDPLFKASAYREALTLRGVYFCGASSPAGGGTAFLGDLLALKVFREQGLARPTQTFLTNRNRRVRLAKLAAALLALLLASGTTYAYFRLDAAKPSVRAYLEELARNLGELRRLRREGRRPDPAVVAHAASGLLEGMTRIDVDEYSAYGLPASWPWVCSLDDNLVEAMVKSFDEIIFRALYFELDRRGRELTDPGHRLPPARFTSFPDEPADALVIVPVERTPELEQLKALAENLHTLESHGERFNALPTSLDLEDLSDLVQFLFGVTLPKDFFEHSRLYREALHAVDLPTFDPLAYKAAATASAEALGQRLYQRLYQESDFIVALEELAPALDALTRNGWSADADPGLFARLLTRIETLEQALAQPELEWVFRERFELGAAYDQALKEVAAATGLGSEEAERLHRDGETGWRNLRQSLLTLSSSLTGPLLAQANGAPQMKLAPDVLLLKSALKSFLGQSFVADGVDLRLTPTIPAGSRLAWDLARLDQAVALAETYDHFTAETLRNFPEALRPSVAEVGRRELAAKLEALLARAQRFEPQPTALTPLLREHELANAVAGFEAAAKPLSRIRDAFDSLRAARPARELTSLVTEEGANLLTELDRLLAAELPYQPREGNFAWWDGRAPLALAAYGANDAAELSAYLDLERGRLEELATRYAGPLLTWLGKAGLERDPELRARALRWESILLALRDFGGKKPGNAVGLLEGFITGELNGLSPAQCPPSPATAATPGAANFFLERRAELRELARRRCTELAATDGRRAYAELARFFNDHLAGRFPFSRAVAQSFAHEAELADVKTFFRLFDQKSAAVFAAAGKSPAAFGEREEETLSFCRQLAEVRKFLAPALDDPDPNAAFGLDVSVDFRVNQRAAETTDQRPMSDSPEVELGGERIIDWRLSIGDRTVTHRDAERKLRWQLGLPIRLELRWAAESPRLPLASFLGADGLTVSYEYPDPWSLLALVASHPSRDPRRETLRLVIVTEPNRALGGESADEPPSRVFVRLTLRAAAAAGKPAEALAVPRFPWAAPQPPTFPEMP